MYKGALGIVGGLGPYAGLDLMAKIFDATDAHSDQEHLPVIQISFPHTIVDRTAFLLGKTSVNPGENIGVIMQTLAQAGATVIGMPCNTAHSPKILTVALEALHKSYPHVKFVHMIDALVHTVQSTYPNACKVGVLSTVATFETALYQSALEKAGLISMAPDGAGRERVQKAIMDTSFGIKACSKPVSAAAKKMLEDEAIVLAEQGADIIILGCTEIPLALTDATLTYDVSKAPIPMIDATSVLAIALLETFAPERRKASFSDKEFPIFTCA